MFFAQRNYEKLLVLKSTKKNRISEKIRDEFYYIVPADDYIKMEQAWIFEQWREINKEKEINK